MSRLRTNMAMKITFHSVIFLMLFLINSCNSTRHNSTPAVSATKTLGTNLEPNLRSTNATSTPTILAKKTETPTAMVSFNSLSVGEYLVLRGNDSHSKKNALYIVTSEGLYVGKLAEGHDFAYAAISPNQEWLAYVNGFNENSVLHVEMISTGRGLYTQ